MLRLWVSLGRPNAGEQVIHHGQRPTPTEWPLFLGWAANVVSEEETDEDLLEDWG